VAMKKVPTREYLFRMWFTNNTLWLFIEIQLLREV